MRYDRKQEISLQLSFEESVNLAEAFNLGEFRETEDMETIEHDKVIDKKTKGRDGGRKKKGNWMLNKRQGSASAAQVPSEVVSKAPHGENSLMQSVTQKFSQSLPSLNYFKKGDSSAAMDNEESNMERFSSSMPTLSHDHNDYDHGKTARRATKSKLQVNHYHSNVASVVNDDDGFRKLKQDLRELNMKTGFGTAEVLQKCIHRRANEIHGNNNVANAGKSLDDSPTDGTKQSRTKQQKFKRSTSSPFATLIDINHNLHKSLVIDDNNTQSGGSPEQKGKRGAKTYGFKRSFSHIGHVSKRPSPS